MALSTTKLTPPPVGSTVTLFATGMGLANPPAVPGSIAGAAPSIPAVPVWTSWDQVNPLPPGSRPSPAAVSTAPGLLSSVFEIQVPVNAAEGKIGTPQPDGVVLVPIDLQFSLYFGTEPVPASNRVNVYIW